MKKYLQYLAFIACFFFYGCFFLLLIDNSNDQTIMPTSKKQVMEVKQDA